MTDMKITTELLAAYVEGNVSQKEREAVRMYLAKNPEIMDSVLFATENDYNSFDSIQPEYNSYINNLDMMLDEIKGHHPFPFQSSPSIKTTITHKKTMAAMNTSDNLCVIRCEGIALRHFGYSISDEELIEESKRNGWLQKAGTMYTDIGKLSQSHGLHVQQIDNCTTEQLHNMITSKNIVIAFVDEGELIGNYIQEKEEDCNYGGCPDHVVIIHAVNKDTVTIKDSYTPEQENTYSLNQFLDAWEDSNNYLVVINK